MEKSLFNTFVNFRFFFHRDQDIWRKSVNEDEAAVLTTDVKYQEILKSVC